MVYANLNRRGYTFYPLRTLPEPPTDKDLLKRYIELMYYFLIADASHDIIGIKGKKFENLNIHYVECIKFLIHQNFPLTPEDVEESLFKIYVMTLSEHTVTNPVAGSVNLPKQGFCSVPRFEIDGYIQRLLPGGAQPGLTSLSSQNVDNFFATQAHLGFILPATITPATWYDMASKVRQNNLFSNLIIWWRDAVGVGPNGFPLQFYVNLKQYGITTRENSYLFIYIQTSAANGDAMNDTNSELFVTIEFMSITKTLRFNLSDIMQNFPVIPTPDGSHLLVSGKDLAKCFFYEIYGTIVSL